MIERLKAGHNKAIMNKYKHHANNMLTYITKDKPSQAKDGYFSHEYSHIKNLHYV